MCVTRARCHIPNRFQHLITRLLYSAFTTVYCFVPPAVRGVNKISRSFSQNAQKAPFNIITKVCLNLVSPPVIRKRVPKNLLLIKQEMAKFCFHLHQRQTAACMHVAGRGCRAVESIVINDRKIQSWIAAEMAIIASQVSPAAGVMPARSSTPHWQATLQDSLQ